MTEDRSGSNVQKRYEIAEDILRSNIIGGVLPEGLVLLEGPIADILQISRAPVQRALQTLEAEGLLHRFSGRGYLVGPPDQGIEPNRTDIKTLGLHIPQHADQALQSRSSWERIYNTVEADVAGCVVFGQYRIVEIELANHFNVSRTVVRDVLTRLRERGLVRKNQSSHWIAGPLTAQIVKDHFVLRRMLEPQAIVVGAGHVDHAVLTDLFTHLSALEREQPKDYFGTVETIQSRFNRNLRSGDAERAAERPDPQQPLAGDGNRAAPAPPGPARRPGHHYRASADRRAFDARRGDGGGRHDGEPSGRFRQSHHRPDEDRCDHSGGRASRPIT